MPGLEDVLSGKFKNWNFSRNLRPRNVGKFTAITWYHRDSLWYNLAFLHIREHLNNNNRKRSVQH